MPEELQNTPAVGSPFLPALKGKFLAFDGPDGSGKSTQLVRLVEACRTAGLEVCHVREPGGTAAGEQIRGILLDRNSEMTLHCEMLLFMASRAQLVEERIRPALAKGQVVIADRFVSSTYAYQGSGGGIPADHIRAVADVAVRGSYPDLVLIFDVDGATAAKRTSGVESIGKKKAAQPATVSLFADRIEERPQDFHAKVRQGFLDLAKSDPAHHIVLDATKAPDAVWSQVCSTLDSWCRKP